MNLLKLIKDNMLKDCGDHILKYCYQISYTTWKSVTIDFISKNSTSLNELAINSIIPLFTKNGTGKSKIEKFFLAKKNELVEESDVQFYLNKLIWERIEHDICWRMVQEDKEFEEVYNKLISLLKTKDFRRYYYLHSSYIVPSKVNQIRGNILSSAKFYELPDHLFTSDIEVIVARILAYLNESTNYFPAIPFIHLIVRMQKFRN